MLKRKQGKLAICTFFILLSSAIPLIVSNHHTCFKFCFIRPFFFTLSFQKRVLSCVAPLASKIHTWIGFWVGLSNYFWCLRQKIRNKDFRAFALTHAKNSVYILTFQNTPHYIIYFTLYFTKILIFLIFLIVYLSSQFTHNNHRLLSSFVLKECKERIAN